MTNKPSTPLSDDSEKILCLGYLQRPRGLKGEIKVIAKGELLERLKQGDEISLYRAAGVLDGFLSNPLFAQKAEIEYLEELNGENKALKITGVETLEAASSFKGYFIGLPLGEAIRLFGNEEEPYMFEFIGMTGETEEGDSLGPLVRVEEYGTGTWFIFLVSGEEFMIPRVEHFVKAEDRDSRKIILANLAELGFEKS